MFSYRLVLCCRMNVIATLSDFSYDLPNRVEESGADLERLLPQENYNLEEGEIPCI